MMNHEACRRNNKNHVLVLHDVTNAFYSPKDDALNEWWENTKIEYVQNLYYHIFNKSVTVMPAADGIAILRQGQGVPPGLSSATDIFNRAYEAPVEKYKEYTDKICAMGVISPFENAGREPGKSQYHGDDPGQSLEAGSDPSGKRLDASKTIFVDDIAASAAVDTCDFVQPTIETLNDTIDDLFEDHGFLQNADKAATLVHLCGEGARHEQWRLDSSEIYTPDHARYLGPQLHKKGDTSIEADIRVKNA